MWWPRVSTRLEQDWVKPGNDVSQFLSSYEEFAEKLRGFGLRERGRCERGEDLDRVEQLLLDCRIWVEERSGLEMKLGKGNDSDWKVEYLQDLLREDSFRGLIVFARQVISKKEERTREEKRRDVRRE